MKTTYVGLIAGALIAVAAGAAVAATPPAPPPVPTITVFDQPNFKGRSMTFDRPVPSLAKLNFNDVIISVQVKGGRDWVLCEHRNFMGKCVRIVAKEKNLKRLKIDGQVSSLYHVPAAQPKRR